MSNGNDGDRFVLAEDAETGITRCFARLPPRIDRHKDPFHRRKWIVSYQPRYGLRPIYSGDGADWSHLAASPFWLNPRLAKRDQIPEGVNIP